MEGGAEEARKKRQGGTHDVPRLRSFRTVTRHMCAKVRPQAMSFTTLFSRADGTHDGPKELSRREAQRKHAKKDKVAHMTCPCCAASGQ